MRIVHSHEVAPLRLEFRDSEKVLGRVSESDLREWVREMAKPRHFRAEKENNRATAEWIAEKLRSVGYEVEEQGSSANIVAAGSFRGDKRAAILVGAHYDSVPGSPGADDNGSAVAAMLACAAALGDLSPDLAVMFAAFNREEDGFVGSSEFVAEKCPGVRFACVHILEMIGFASSAPGSQRHPTGLPIQLRGTGDFLGLLANEQSAAAMELILQLSRSVVEELPVTGLQVGPGAERVFPVLARSDHVPFWRQNIPAVMWTDTAEFRNPNYHLPSDTPETLDYGFLQRVAKLLTACVLQQASALDRK